MTSALKITRAIVQLVGTAPAFQNRQVTEAHPAAHAEQEFVFVSGVRATEQARSLGKAFKREELTVELGLVVEVNADDPSDALDRAYRMFTELEDVIAGSPTLGVAGVLFAQVGSWDQRMFAADGKRVVEMTVDVLVTSNKEA
jgi:hypothetical protein